VPFNVTGLPGLSIRFGTSRNGLPIGVQLVSGWLAESTVLHLASLLETAIPVRDLPPRHLTIAYDAVEDAIKRANSLRIRRPY
jgi:Amidase